MEVEVKVEVESKGVDGNEIVPTSAKELSEPLDEVDEEIERPVDVSEELEVSEMGFREATEAEGFEVVADVDNNGEVEEVKKDDKDGDDKSEISDTEKTIQHQFLLLQ